MLDARKKEKKPLHRPDTRHGVFVTVGYARQCDDGATGHANYDIVAIGSGIELDFSRV